MGSPAQSTRPPHPTCRLLSEKTHGWMLHYSSCYRRRELSGRGCLSQERQSPWQLPVVGLGAPSIAQIEKLIGELHEARGLLEAEEERVRREAARYVKFRSDGFGLRKNHLRDPFRMGQAGHLLQKFVARSPADGSANRAGHPFDSSKGAASSC